MCPLFLSLQTLLAPQETQPVFIVVILDKQLHDIWVVKACRNTMVGFQLLVHVCQNVDIRNHQVVNLLEE